MVQLNHIILFLEKEKSCCYVPVLQYCSKRNYYILCKTDDATRVSLCSQRTSAAELCFVFVNNLVCIIQLLLFLLLLSCCKFWCYVKCNSRCDESERSLFIYYMREPVNNFYFTPCLFFVFFFWFYFLKSLQLNFNHINHCRIKK